MDPLKLLCKDFKTVLEKITEEEIRVHIHTNMAPQGEHQGCFNDPSTDEVAILIVGNEYGKRDIMLQNRDSAWTLKYVSETHRYASGIHEIELEVMFCNCCAYPDKISINP